PNTHHPVRLIRFLPLRERAFGRTTAPLATAPRGAFFCRHVLLPRKCWHWIAKSKLNPRDSVSIAGIVPKNCRVHMRQSTDDESVRCRQREVPASMGLEGSGRDRSHTPEGTQRGQVLAYVSNR